MDVVCLDIPIDQELPDDEPGRRNQDIVKSRKLFGFLISFVFLLALLSMGTIHFTLPSFSILFSSNYLANTKCSIRS